MGHDEATALVVDIAKSFSSLVRAIEPGWQKAYFRFASEGSSAEAKASYTREQDTEIVDAMKHKTFFHPVIGQGKKLLTALGKSEGLFLLVIDSNLSYDIKFEYHDMNRWRISKFGGGTGVPEGLD